MYEIEITQQALNGMPQDLIFELETFFHSHSGWEMWDKDYDASKIIRFTEPQTFKYFLVQFAEARKSHALTKEDAIKELRKVLIT